MGRDGNDLLARRAGGGGILARALSLQVEHRPLAEARLFFRVADRIDPAGRWPHEFAIEERLAATQGDEVIRLRLPFQRNSHHAFVNAFHFPHQAISANQ